MNLNAIGAAEREGEGGLAEITVLLPSAASAMIRASRGQQMSCRFGKLALQLLTIHSASMAIFGPLHLVVSW